MSNPTLQVSGLSKSFGSLRANSDVSFEVRPGEIHALIGPNGAGKSTLMKMLAGEIKQDTGSVLFEGACIDHLSASARANLGMVRTFQISSLLPEMTVAQNLRLAAIGKSQRPWAFFRRAAKDQALEERVTNHIGESQLLSVKDERVSAISHGQRRSLEVAMAQCLAPRLLLMDEPMAGMGAEGSAALIARLKKIKNNTPILLVEHDMDAVFALADRLSVLVGGQIIASGRVNEIKDNKAVQSAYLGSENAA